MTESSRLEGLDLTRFREEDYLGLYPDVEVLVRAGVMPSGLHHYLHHGAEEGRIGPGERLRIDEAVKLESWKSLPEHISVVGPFSSPTGLGRAARGYLHASLTFDPKARGVDFDPYVRDAVMPADAHSLLEESRFHHWVVNGDVLHEIRKLISPSRVRSSVSVASWFWELASSPRHWERGLPALDEIWAPSAFSAAAFARMSPLDVAVVPPVVEIPEHDLLGRQELGLPTGAFIVLSMFDSSSYLERKNPRMVIRAFQKAFGSDPSFHLVLKTQASRGNSSAIEELRAHAAQPNITFIERDVDDVTNYSLKVAADCFVSAHRSEGFGLNVAESMLLGTPVISTDYSSTAEFVSDATGYPLDYDLCVVGTDTGPYPAGAVWARPREDSLVELLQRVATNPTEADQRARLGQERVREGFSSRAIGKIVRKRLGGLEERLRSAGSLFGPELPLLSVPEAQTRRSQNDLSGLPLGSEHRVSVICPVHNVAPDVLLACIESVRSQTYANWELCLVDDASTRLDTRALLQAVAYADPRIKVEFLPENVGIASASNRAVEFSTGSYIALLDNDDLLAPHALESMMRHAAVRPDIVLWYSDEDKLNEAGEFVDPYFKPDWSPEHLESCMYLLHLMMMKKDTFLEVGGFRAEFSGAQDYDLALRFSLLQLPIGHVPEVLYHWRKIPGSSASQHDAKPAALDRAKQALTEYAHRRYGGNSWVEEGHLYGLWRVRMPQEQLPPFTIVIPTNDGIDDVPGRGRVELLKNALESLVMTEYPDWSILIVDNGNLSDSRRVELGLTSEQVVSYPGSQASFNFAAKVNFAIRHVKTEHFVILNDDIEVTESGWLTALAEVNVRQGVGAVGARLIGADGRLQHVGMVGGVNGSTAHIYHGQPRSTVGHNGYAVVIRNYSMVTGACMATKRSVWTEVGGFDEDFATDFNDSDYCLRLQTRGYRVAYTPFAELIHFEGSTLPRLQSAIERRRFLERWGRSGYISNDPYFNPNFSRMHADLRPIRGYRY